MSLDNPLPPGLALAWGVTSPGRRGPKPTHSVEEIVHAAVQLADDEGLAALSLPRIAGRVGVTTNALYRYISSKDELIVLLRDAAWGRPPESIRRAATWREAATAWAQAAIERYLARPWLFELPVPGAPMTPNLLRWLETLLESMEGTGLSGRDRLGCALLLDGYAYSTANLTHKIQSAATEPEQAANAFGFLLPRLRSHDFPILAELLATGAYRSQGEAAGSVDFGLQRLLDGIDVLITTRNPHGEPANRGLSDS